MTSHLFVWELLVFAQPLVPTCTQGGGCQ